MSKKIKEQEEYRKGKSKIWAILFLLFLLIASFGVSYFFYAKYLSKEEYSKINAAALKSISEEEYYTEGKLESINVDSFFLKKPKKVSYEIYIRPEHKILDGSVKYKRNFDIQINGLVNGRNILVLTYEYKNGSEKVFNYVIYNSYAENEENLEIKNQDEDKDGLTDYFEIVYSNSDPNNNDSDSDGINDSEEDSDNDGLTDLQEQNLGTNPLAYDTDTDGISDFEEVNIGTDPLKIDTDGDGIIDGKEVEIHSDPLIKDEDSIVDYSKEKEFYSGLNVSVDISAKAKNAATFNIFEIPKTYAISSEQIDGLVGTGISFSMDGSFEKSHVEIEIPKNLNKSKNYYLYYVNEKEMIAEMVENQSQNGNVVSADLEHFSKYFISIDKGKKYRVIPDETGGMFDSYSDYVKNMYPEMSVLSFNVNTNNWDGLTYYFGESGHSFMSYYYFGDDENLSAKKMDQGNQNENEATSGFGIFTKKSFGLTPEVGAILLPSRYRQCYEAEDGTLKSHDNNEYKKIVDENNNIMNVKPESTANAIISMPFVIDENQLGDISDFANNYVAYYMLFVNNCTTYVRDGFSFANVDNKIEICSWGPASNIFPSVDNGYNPYIGKTISFYDENGNLIKIQDWSIKNFIEADRNRIISGYGESAINIGGAGSPAQAAYSIRTQYPYEFVFNLSFSIDGNTYSKYASLYSIDCALTSENVEAVEEDTTEEVSEEEKIDGSAEHGTIEITDEWCKNNLVNNASLNDFLFLVGNMRNMEDRHITDEYKEWEFLNIVKCNQLEPLETNDKTNAQTISYDELDKFFKLVTDEKVEDMIDGKDFYFAVPKGDGKMEIPYYHSGPEFYGAKIVGDAEFSEFQKEIQLIIEFNYGWADRVEVGNRKVILERFDDGKYYVVKVDEDDASISDSREQD